MTPQDQMRENTLLQARLTLAKEADFALTGIKALGTALSMAEQMGALPRNCEGVKGDLIQSLPDVEGQVAELIRLLASDCGNGGAA
jgi:hypothetical protein